MKPAIFLLIFLIIAVTILIYKARNLNTAQQPARQNKPEKLVIQPGQVNNYEKRAEDLFQPKKKTIEEYTEDMVEGVKIYEALVEHNPEKYLPILAQKARLCLVLLFRQRNYNELAQVGGIAADSYEKLLEKRSVPDDKEQLISAYFYQATALKMLNNEIVATATDPQMIAAAREDGYIGPDEDNLFRLYEDKIVLTNWQINGIRRKAIKLMEELSQTDSSYLGRIAMEYRWMGDADYQNNDPEDAMYCYTKAIEYYEKSPEKDDSKAQSIAALYTEIGVIYREMNQHDKALEYFKKGMELVKNMDVTTKATLYFNLGQEYEQKTDYRVSIEHYKKAIEVMTPFYNESPDKHVLAIGQYQTYLARTYLSAGNTTAALETCNKVQELLEPYSQDIRAGRLLQQISQLKGKVNGTDESKGELID